MAKTTEPLTEWTPEADAHWKDPAWWQQPNAAKEHLAMDELFDHHIHKDFQLNDWTEPTMNQVVYFVASAGGLLTRVVKGYDYSEESYFLCDPTKGTETKAKPERVWAKPEDALIYKLRAYSRDMIHRTPMSNSAVDSCDSSRQRFRRMLRFMLQQLESL